jgi:hypothetical protein
VLIYTLVNAVAERKMPADEACEAFEPYLELIG